MQRLRSGRYTKLSIALIASPLVVLSLAGVMTEGVEARARHNVAYASVAALKESLGVRRNLEFDTVRITDAGAACIGYRARDAQGATSRAQAVVNGRDVAKSGASDGRFAKEWNRQCLGLAHDVTNAVDRFF